MITHWLQNCVFQNLLNYAKWVLLYVSYCKIKLKKKSLDLYIALNCFLFVDQWCPINSLKIKDKTLRT